MDVKRDVVVALLEKMGAPHTTKISMDRAVQKLKRYIQKNGMPVGMTMTGAEKAVVNAILNNKPTTPPPPPTHALARVPEGKKASNSKAEKAAKTAKAPVVDWITVASRAILKSRNMKQAAEVAVKDFTKAGGKTSSNTPKWGVLYTSYASKALIEAKVIEVSNKGDVTVL